MTKQKTVKITRSFAMLSFTAVLADLFYIICRMLRPVRSVEDALFHQHIPDMLGHMLLATAVITAFLAIMTYIIKNESCDL